MPTPLVLPVAPRAALSAVCLLLAACGAAAPPVASPASSPAATATAAATERTVDLDGLSFHVREAGAGETVVFLHGALMDYREWVPVADLLADDWRTVTYSRRFNHPNENAFAGHGHSAHVDAADLERLIAELGGGPVDLVGLSFGGLTALVLAIDRPELVRSLTLVEPPIMAWLPGLPGGEAEARRVEEELFVPAAAAFRAGDGEGALRSTFDHFIAPGAFERFPDEVADLLRANLGEWEALMTSEGAFPPVPREAVASLDLPVLMISGGQTLSYLTLIDDELERLLPRVDRLTVADGSHDVCSEQPAVCAAAIRAHLERR